MKSVTKFLTVVSAILLLSAVFANAQNNSDKKSPRPALSEDYVQTLLDELKVTDSAEAERIEKLRTENPRLFHVEIRKLAWKQRSQEDSNRPMADFEKFRQRERDRRFRADDLGDAKPEMGMRQRPGPGGKDERFAQMESEFITWLEKNDSAKAAELAELKKTNQHAYARSISIEMRKYRRIMDAEQSNPALAETLKADLELKDKRNEILTKLRTATDEDVKAGLQKELSEVVGQRFDIIVQKKQLRYAELQQKLEELKKELEQNQGELDNFKGKKSEYIEDRVKNLVEKSDSFNWD